jgi:hypothetical protein
MAKRVICELCGRLIPPHAHYVVRIDVFADPSIPEISSADLEEADLQKAMDDLLEEMKQFTSEELEEQVFRRFEYQICRPCQIRFLGNPLGKPREKKTGKN